MQSLSADRELFEELFEDLDRGACGGLEPGSRFGAGKVHTHAIRVPVHPSSQVIVSRSRFFCALTTEYFIHNYGGKHAPGNMAVNTRRTVLPFLCRCFCPLELPERNSKRLLRYSHGVDD